MPVCTAGLDTSDVDSLFEKAFDLAAMSTAIYKDPTKHESWLPGPLKELCRFKVWHAQFQAFDLYADGPGQCTGYATTYGTKEYCEKAREKYKEYPLILSAIEENADYWKKLDDKGQ